MYKAIIPFYIICFGLYVFFSRHPDYADGEFTQGKVHFGTDSASQKPVPKAVFSIETTSYAVDASYLLRKLWEGEDVTIIYEASDPRQATVYRWWGYWIRWDELLASVLIPVVFLFAAKAITGNPTAEALIEELEIN